MNARLFRAKHAGQSIPIIALILVVLFAMVGLSVDVGNTYAENRNAVRSTNAATLAGMDRLIRGGGDTAVGDAIKASFKSNGITAQMDPTIALASGERRIFAYYLDSYGNPLGNSCTVGKCGGLPKNIAYIQVRTEGTVDTYFARVVGRNTLPVNAQAFAGQCSPVEGVYPIAVNAANLDFTNKRFYPPTGTNAAAEMPYYGMYYDDKYDDGRTQRRIWRKSDFSQPGNFDWLEWTGSDGSAKELAPMLEGDGNLGTGFNEVVMSPPIKSSSGVQFKTGWPDPNSNEVDGYPLLPGQLSEGDWIYGNSGNSGSSDVKAALDYHIANRTVLNLPIVDRVSGPGGANSYYHVLKLGAFLLRGYNLTGQGYFDLVYVGESSKTACLSENVNPKNLNGLGLSGQVYVNPRWQKPVPPSQPIAYQIVLDVSGSMSWDFNGYGTYDGSNSGSGFTVPNSVKGDVQCESPTNPNPSNLKFTDRCGGGPNSTWKNQNERRVYVAKQAIYQFISNMGQYDVMRVIAFSDSQANNAAALTAWTGDKTTLHDAVEDAGAYNNNPYRTSGLTPGPQALQKASDMFRQSNGYNPTAANGVAFRPVVIYITDGVANVFLDGAVNTARDICSDLSASQARNTADPCQIGVTASGKERPITAMINIANDLKADMSNLTIYTVGLAQVPETGLPRVASGGKHFSVRQANLVDDILAQIQAEVTGATCVSAGGYSWLNTIDPAHAPGGYPFTTLGSGTYGQVFIYEPGAGTPKYTLPIRLDTSIDSLNGKLSYVIMPPAPNDPNNVGVTPGVYEMEAYVGYKGEDGKTNSYAYFINSSSLQSQKRITVDVTSGGTLGGMVPMEPIFLDLSKDIDICGANG